MFGDEKIISGLILFSAFVIWWAWNWWLVEPIWCISQWMHYLRQRWAIGYFLHGLIGSSYLYITYLASLIVSVQWKRLPTSNDPPPPRAYHSMSCIGSRYLLFGGFDGKSAFGDLWWLVPEGSSSRICIARFPCSIGFLLLAVSIEAKNILLVEQSLESSWQPSLFENCDLLFFFFDQLGSDQLHAVK